MYLKGLFNYRLYFYFEKFIFTLTYLLLLLWCTGLVAL